MDFNKCSTKTKDSRVVVKEHRSKFELINKDKLVVTKIQTDGCLIGEDKEKCDWIFAVERPNKIAMFIELKGCGVDKAISQLKSTLKLTLNKFKNHKKRCYVVTTRVPKHGPKMHKKALKFFKDTNVVLITKNATQSVTL